jgi:hypothetical protein
MPREIPPKGTAKPAATKAEAAKKTAPTRSAPKPTVPEEPAPARAAAPAKSAAAEPVRAAIPATAIPAAAIPVAAIPATAIPATRFNLTGASAFAVPAAFDVTAAAPVITRGGRELPPVKLDRTRLEEIFIIPPKQQQTRVVGQDPPAGTFVPRGSTINLFVAPAGEVPFEVFESPHLDFTGKTVADLAPVLEDSRVRTILDRNATSGTVPEADRKVLTELLQERGVEIQEDDAERSFDRAFRTVREASVFG